MDTPWLLSSPEHTPLFSQHDVSFTVYTSVKTYAFVLKQQMEKPYSMILSEKMTPNSQRGADGAVAESKEPQNMGSNTVYYGVTLGKLLTVFLFRFPHL